MSRLAKFQAAAALLLGIASSAFAQVSVTMTAPANGATFTAPATITLSATATPPTGYTISKVDFYQGTTLIGTDTTSPYSISWSNVAQGTYSLTAQATATKKGAANQTGTSSAVNITVNPWVTLTAPSNGSTFTPGSTITLNATATAPSGYTITKVEFFQGTTLIGTDTTAPYSVNWTNVPSGSYALTAKGTATKGASTQTSTSYVSNITVNANPTVSITSPANGAVFASPANITINATASDSDGTISKVEFFEGATLLGTSTTSPYSVSLTNVAAGSHTYTAKATDNRGGATTSSAISVSVDVSPTVSITTPANNSVFTAPANFTLTASAGDSDGSISKVDFFDGATLVGTATAAPYSVSLSNVAAGSHSYTARATDNQGIQTTSTVVSVLVNVAPSVSITGPANNALYTAPASFSISASASDSDGTISKVDFYQSGTLIGTATSAPYSASVANLAAGPYSFTAVATDNSGGHTTSSAISVTVDAAPTVLLTAPANNATFTAPANIVITAQASDADGNIARVEFYYGATLITTLTGAPYTFTWSAVPQASYSLTAKAYDNNGIVTTSAAVNITVNQSVAALYFVHVDHLNTPRLIADAAGTTVWRNDNREPFGDSPPDENPSGAGAFEFPLRFSGQYADKETNLAYNFFRDYDQALGRYLQSDPIGLTGGLSTFGYVFQRPLRMIDSLGLYGYGNIVEFWARYCSGLGASTATSFGSIDWGDMDERVRASVAAMVGTTCAERTISVWFQMGVQAGGADRYIIGRHVVKVTGEIKVKCDCSWTYSGAASSALGYDPYDFDASNRGFLGEALVWIGRTSCSSSGKAYNIYLTGSKPEMASGTINGGAATCCRR
jgi:RHS repeat-associated protein